jgi:hypothetical protein
LLFATIYLFAAHRRLCVSRIVELLQLGNTADQLGQFAIPERAVAAD